MLLLLTETTEASAWDVEHIIALSNVLLIAVSAWLSVETARAARKEHEDDTKALHEVHREDQRTLRSIVRMILRRGEPPSTKE